MIPGSTPQVPELYDWPLFWVNVVAAAGTVGAVVVMLKPQDRSRLPSERRHDFAPYWGVEWPAAPIGT